MHIVIWIFIALGFVLWTLTAWGTATLLGLDSAWLGNVGPHLKDLPFAAVLEVWWPGWQAAAVTLLELTRSVLAWAGGAGQWIVWLIWALGAAALLGGGALLSAAVAVGRRTLARHRPVRVN